MYSKKHRGLSTMKKMKVLKIIGGFCAGAGIGLCIGVAAHNVLVGVLVGLGLGCCFAVTFNSFKNE